MMNESKAAFFRTLYWKVDAEPSISHKEAMALKRAIMNVWHPETKEESHENV